MCDSLAQPVEHLPFKEVVVGSNPTRVTIFFGPLRLVAQDPVFSRQQQRFKSSRGRQILFFGRLAQLVERHPYKVDVISSSLIATTIFL